MTLDGKSTSLGILEDAGDDYIAIRPMSDDEDFPENPGQWLTKAKDAISMVHLHDCQKCRDDEAVRTNKEAETAARRAELSGGQATLLLTLTRLSPRQMGDTTNWLSLRPSSLRLSASLRPCLSDHDDSRTGDTTHAKPSQDPGRRVHLPIVDVELLLQSSLDVNLGQHAEALFLQLALVLRTASW